MSKKTALFIFHRDLRIVDNTSLNEAVRDGYAVLPIFIFPPEQINKNANEYFSNNAVQFMCESLEDLNNSLKEIGSELHIVKGDTIKVLKELHSRINYSAIYFNEDYSIYAKERDNKVRELCKTLKIKCVSKEDYGLLPLMDCLVENDRPYVVFTPFYKKISRYVIRNVDKIAFTKSNFTKSDEAYPIEDIYILYNHNKYATILGGRTNGKKMLSRLKTLEFYQTERDFPAMNKTSLASPHLKFGTVSIREIYHKISNLFGTDHGLIRELVFREFYLKIYAIKSELQRDVAYYDKLDKSIKWSYDEKLFNVWREGITGYPLVDAGMRELKATGHQHNRVRMLCASVLTKYFLIDWRMGMKYYYTSLVDADIFSNTAGWQWASSTGPSSVPYFRPPLNPFIQSKKFDKDVAYIKKWIPELKNVEANDIHKWYDKSIREKYKNIKYNEPILDHAIASKRAVEVFKTAQASIA